MRNYLATFKRIFPGIHYVLASFTLLLGVFTLTYALGISQGFFLRSWVTTLDKNVLDLVLTQRGDTRSGFFLFFTYLGNWEIIASLTLVILLIMFLARKFRAMWFLISVLIVGQLSSSIFKFLLARSRPDTAHALIAQGGYSFPSGHALGSFFFYGTLTYFVYTLARNRLERILTTLSGLGLIALIGISRLYLGVHWLSDVVAGWIMGATILIVFIVFFEHRKALFPIAHHEAILSRQTLMIVATLLSAAEAAFIVWYYLAHPIL